MPRDIITADDVTRGKVRLKTELSRFGSSFETDFPLSCLIFLPHSLSPTLTSWEPSIWMWILSDVSLVFLTPPFLASDFSFFLSLARSISLPPGLVVEDAPAGAQSGLAAGAIVLAVGTGYAPKLVQAVRISLLVLFLSRVPLSLWTRLGSDLLLVPYVVAFL